MFRQNFFLKILTFNNKSNEMSLRVAAMDYLALIASHLRRDAVESRGRDKDDLKDIIEQVSQFIYTCYLFIYLFLVI